MPRVETGLPYQLAYRQRFHGGCRLLGFGMLLMGLVVGVANGLLPAEHISPRTLLASYAFAALSAAGGTLLLLGRRGKLFDNLAGTATYWWGLPWPIGRTVYNLRAYGALGIEARGDREPPGWRVFLHGPRGARLVVFDLQELSTAQFAAGQIAGFLSLPIVNLLAPPAKTDAPPGQAAVVRPGGDRWSYRRPAPGLIRLLGWVLLPMGGVLCAGAVGAAVGTNAPRPELPPLAFGGLALLLGALLMASGRRLRFDRRMRAITIWPVWPLPLDRERHDLSAYHGVIVASDRDGSGATDAARVVGLVGPRHARLELMRCSTREEAQRLAAAVAELTGLMLIDEGDRGP